MYWKVKKLEFYFEKISRKPVLWIYTLCSLQSHEFKLEIPMFIIRKDQANTLLRKTNKNKENDKKSNIFFNIKDVIIVKWKNFRIPSFLKI